MTLACFTSPGLIIPQVRGQNAATVIQELAQALQREGRVPDWLPCYQAALSRESLGGTDMEDGMAFPHARLTGLKELSFALGRSDGSLDWRAGTARPVRLVFLLAVPESDPMQYLRLISGLVRLAKAGPLVEQLHAAQDASQIIGLLRQVELKASSKPAPPQSVAAPPATGRLMEP